MVWTHHFTLDALLVVSIVLLVTVAPLLSPSGTIGAATGTALLAVVAWLARCRAAAPLAAFSVVCLGLALGGVPYSQLVLGVGLLSYAAVVRATPWLRGTATGARRGPLTVTFASSRLPQDSSLRSRCSVGTCSCIRTSMTSSRLCA